ncbi:MAG: hypothetical protein ACRC92_23965 [Peptostreptococcaceae bacterium]
MSLSKYFKSVKDIDQIKVYTKEANDALDRAKREGWSLGMTLREIEAVANSPTNRRLVSEEELMILGVKNVDLAEYPIPYVPFTSDDLLDIVNGAEDINDHVRINVLNNIYSGDRQILQNVFDMFSDGMNVEDNLREYVCDELTYICAYGGGDS